MLGEILAEDFEGDRVLERMLVYERRIESSLYRTMAELRRLQKDRQAEAKAAAAREKLALAGLPQRTAESDSDAGDETSDGVTTNAPEEPTRQTKPMAGEVPGGPHRASNEQSQSPADQSEGNLSRHEGLGQEEGLEPWPEQSETEDDLVPHEPAWNRRQRREAASLCLV
jgi:hypothetical protein